MENLQTGNNYPTDVKGVDIIYKYFSNLSQEQRDRFRDLGPLYASWNTKINVISRKDIDNIYPHHILHSLAIGKFLTPAAGTEILDFGCGGGFPGIPLAILWPDCHFHLIDRIGKKIFVANEIAAALSLTNISVQHGDASECHRKFDYVVSRAVMRLETLAPLARRNISPKSRNELPNGLICLKGGDLASEIIATRGEILEIPVSDYFQEPFFQEKKLIYKPIHV